MTVFHRFTSFPHFHIRMNIFVQRLEGVLILWSTVNHSLCFEIPVRTLYSLVMARWSSVSYHYFYVWEVFPFTTIVKTPFSETAFYYGLSQLAQLTQPNGNCSHTLTAETSSWSVLPRHAAAPCGLQLFLHSKAVICSQPACLQSVSRNPDVSLSITVLEYSTVSKQPLTHRTRETSSRAMVIRTGSLEQFKLWEFIKQHLKSTSFPTKLCYLSCMYLQTTADITVTSHFHNSCVEQEM